MKAESLGSDQIVGDNVGDRLSMLALVADRGGEHGGRKYADTVGAKILKEPRYRGQNGRAQILSPEQHCVAAQPGMVVMLPGRRFSQRDLRRIARGAVEQAQNFTFCFAHASAHGQPVRALGHEKARQHDKHGRDDGHAIHPAPSLQIGIGIRTR